jgi:hypothetical protein
MVTGTSKGGPDELNLLMGLSVNLPYGDTALVRREDTMFVDE